MDEEDLKFRRERLERTQEGTQRVRAIMQTANMRDFARQFARKTKFRRSYLEPATSHLFGRNMVKSGIHLDRRKMARVKLEPLRRGKIGWIKCVAPFFVTPGARSDTDFLLIDQIQNRNQPLLKDTSVVAAVPDPGNVANEFSRSPETVDPGDKRGRPLDAIVQAVTLREEMKYRLRFILLLAAACLAFPERSPAPVLFKPGKGMKYHPPGEELISENAKELAAKAESAAKEGNSKRAIKLYSKLLKRYRRDVLAPEASFRIGELQEQRHNYLRAAGAYRYLVENYPQSSHFDEAIEGQFRIGELFLAGKKRKILGVTISNMLDAAVEIFASVVRSAPYGKYTARAQFDIGLAREKQGQAEAALTAYQAVVDKFPNEPVAADAQYQIGYLWYSAARAGAKDPNAVSKATTGFQDFLFRYPHSEKAPQARENLARLENKATKDSFGIAKFYDKRGNYRAAVIYYNDVIRQQPGSSQGDEAKRRIDQLRSKIGDAAVKEIEVAANAPKKKPRNVAEAGESHEGAPAMRTSPNDVAPLPPPEDVSLPPPASLAPDTTTAPAVSPTPDESPTPAESPTPESTASPTP